MCGEKAPPSGNWKEYSGRHKEHPTAPYDQPGNLWRHSNAPLQSVPQLDSTKVVLFSPVQLDMTTRPAKKHRGI